MSYEPLGFKHFFGAGVGDIVRWKNDGGDETMRDMLIFRWMWTQSLSKVEYVPNLLHWLTNGKAGLYKWDKIIISDADGKVTEKVEGDDVLKSRIAQGA